MLTFFSEKKRLKIAKQAAESFEKGLKFLTLQEYVLAAKEIESALRLDAENGVPLLSTQFEEHASFNNIKEAAVLGDILCQYEKKDYSLANRVGNYLRRSGNIKKANALYKRSYYLNKDDETALYNMAACMAKVPVYDGDVKQLVEKYIHFDGFLLPKSIYPRDQKMLGALAGVLNKKHFFSKVEKIQELILEKALTEKEPDYEQIDQLILKVKKKLAGEVKFDEERPDAIGLLKEALEHNWGSLPAQDKDRFLWNVLNLGLHVLSEHCKTVESNESGSPKPDLRLAIDTFVKLKVEHYSYRYLDMVIAIAHYLSEESDLAINELKSSLAHDPNDRYFNINMGILYQRTGKRLLSLVYLVKSASLLEELEGASHLSDIIQLADRKYQEGSFKQALKLYKLALLETDNVDLLAKIGQVLISLSKFHEAIQPYKEILRLEPTSEIANNKLDEIQEHFYFLGNEFQEAGSFVNAADNYERALEIKKTSQILLRATTVYKSLGNNNREFELREEYREQKAKQKKLEVESEREQHVKQGVIDLKKLELQSSIAHFQKAFKLRPDKDTFIFLSYLYKKSNQKIALKDLMNQWNSINPENR
ncbi:hypothetical protein KKA14_07765, partial [bacterium]|nr:hypothetical protein [bacterium]